MRIKGKTKRVISCFLAMLTVASTVVQPIVTYAAEPSDTSVEFVLLRRGLTKRNFSLVTY